MVFVKQTVSKAPKSISFFLHVTCLISKAEVKGAESSVIRLDSNRFFLSSRPLLV